tara:strand:+ start:4512 stop:4757 length:246 start_codon:yes stop_codon:yes gene_type:complete
MDYRNKKLTSVDIAKIDARYLNKLEEFKIKTLDELKEIFNTKGLSNTDKNACIVATNFIMKNNLIKSLPELKDGKEEGITE